MKKFFVLSFAWDVLAIAFVALLITGNTPSGFMGTVVAEVVGIGIAKNMVLSALFAIFDDPYIFIPPTALNLLALIGIFYSSGSRFNVTRGEDLGILMLTVFIYSAALMLRALAKPEITASKPETKKTTKNK